MTSLSTGSLPKSCASAGARAVNAITKFLIECARALKKPLRRVCTQNGGCLWRRRINPSVHTAGRIHRDATGRRRHDASGHERSACLQTQGLNATRLRGAGMTGPSPTPSSITSRARECRCASAPARGSLVPTQSRVALPLFRPPSLPLL